MEKDNRLGNILTAEQIIELVEAGEQVIIPAFALKPFVLECEAKRLECVLELKVVQIKDSWQQIGLITKWGAKLKLNKDGTIDL